MQVVGVQLEIAWEEPEANHERVWRLLAAAPPPAGALVVLPEMFATGFSMNVERIADAERATERFLAELAREFSVTVLGGLVVRAPSGRGRNQALAVSASGDQLCRYSKLHPFSYGDEGRHYERGDEIVTFAWASMTVAPFICYDLRFPEAFRAAVCEGAQLCAVIANWPNARVDHWDTLLRARAIENQAYVVGVNRCGRDPQFAYPGRTQLIDPRGRILAEAGEEEALVQASVSVQAVETYRREFPALADRHPRLAGRGGR